MASKKKSASLIAAQAEYFAKHNIKLPVKGYVEPVEEIKSKTEERSPYGLSTAKEHGIYIQFIGRVKPLVIMEDKEIFTKILLEYEKALNHITGPDMIQEAYNIREFLISKHMNYGVCYFSKAIFNVSIACKHIISKYCNINSDYWHDIPNKCFTVEELVKCISKRVEILKNIVKYV